MMSKDSIAQPDTHFPSIQSLSVTTYPVAGAGASKLTLHLDCIHMIEC